MAPVDAAARGRRSAGGRCSRRSRPSRLLSTLVALLAVLLVTAATHAAATGATAAALPTLPDLRRLRAAQLITPATDVYDAATGNAVPRARCVNARCTYSSATRATG